MFVVFSMFLHDFHVYIDHPLEIFKFRIQNLKTQTQLFHRNSFFSMWCFSLCVWLKPWKKLSPGLFPDFMHIMHLACAVDSLTSILLDLVEEDNLVAGSTRDQKLDTLWQNYRDWAETNRALDVTVLGENCLFVKVYVWFNLYDVDLLVASHRWP